MFRAFAISVTNFSWYKKTKDMEFFTWLFFYSGIFHGRPIGPLEPASEGISVELMFTQK
jgi:hypothetical protein